MLVERYNQYKTAAMKAKQAGNDEVAIKHIRTAKVIDRLMSGVLCEFFLTII